MRTPKQIAASRANGAKSKGPVTAQGKRNSSRNSIRHGLFADTIVLEEEKKDEFFELLHELLDEHQPATPTETMMVETIAAARWRQDRIWGMQKVAFDHDVSTSPDPSAIPPLRAVLSLQSSPEKVRSHELLLRYASPSTAKFPEPSSAFNSSRRETGVLRAKTTSPIRSR
jgi:hypothetical protein